jgi:hypothetical protein
MRAPTDHPNIVLVNCDDLEAVRSGRRKLHVSRVNRQTRRVDNVIERYDLERDIGETNNVAAQYPEIVRAHSA